jgi:Sulfotransferase domain
MKVIGAGLPRTATLSQHAAMEILGFKPVYHMATVFEKGQAPEWREVLDGKRSAAELLADYEATVDWPGSYYTKDLAEAYPDAKIVLSERDPESWAQSMVKTIWGLFYADNLMRHLSDARASIDPGWKFYLTMMKEMWFKAELFEAGDGPGTSPEFLAKAFVRRNDELKAALPPERLLVWSAKDGWGPLCEFLEVPIPDEPFPQINDSGHFAEWMIGPALQKIEEYRATESRELEGAAGRR